MIQSSKEEWAIFKECVKLGLAIYAGPLFYYATTLVKVGFFVREK